MPSRCVDWTTTVEADWTISVDPGDTGSMYLNIRDSHPGDFCWIGDLDRKELRNGQTTLLATHANGPLVDDGPLPIAVVDACGPEYTDDADSLVFIAMPGGKPSTVTVTVEPIS